jgi:hypothetical protein
VRTRREHLIGLAVTFTFLLALAGCADVASMAGSDSAPSSASPSASETPTASPSGVAEVPLADGYPAVNGNDQTPVEVTSTSGLTDLVFCGQTGWSPGGPVPAADLIGATYTGEAEDVRARTLARYDTPTDAKRAMTSLRDVVASCTEEPVGGTTHFYSIHDLAVGQEAYLLMHRYRSEYGFDTGLELIGAVRVGDLLLLDLLYGEGGGSPESIAASRGFRLHAAGAVVAAMCELAGPCPDSTWPADDRLVSGSP